jgi:hypothetical protein
VILPWEARCQAPAFQLFGQSPEITFIGPYAKRASCCPDAARVVGAAMMSRSFDDRESPSAVDASRAPHRPS